MILSYFMFGSLSKKKNIFPQWVNNLSKLIIKRNTIYYGNLIFTLVADSPLHIYLKGAQENDAS